MSEPGSGDISVARNYSDDLIVVIRIQSHPETTSPCSFFTRTPVQKLVSLNCVYFNSFFFTIHPFTEPWLPPFCCQSEIVHFTIASTVCVCGCVCSWGCTLPKRTKEYISIFLFFRWGLTFPLCVRLLCNICCVGRSASLCLPRTQTRGFAVGRNRK